MIVHKAGRQVIEAFTDILSGGFIARHRPMSLLMRAVSAL
jgi:hypothetical protein